MTSRQLALKYITTKPSKLSDIVEVKCPNCGTVATLQFSSIIRTCRKRGAYICRYCIVTEIHNRPGYKEKIKTAMLAQSAKDSERVIKLWEDKNFRERTLAGIQKQKHLGGNSIQARSFRAKKLWQNQSYRATVVAAVNRTRVPMIFTAAIRKKLSEATTKAAAEGRIHPTGQRTLLYTKKGGNFLTKSSWETTYAKMLDDNPKVISFRYEPIRIPYQWDGNTHFYLPDFLVRYIDHEELIEIKPKKLVNSLRNIAKIKGAQQQDIVIQIITEDEFDF